MSGEEARFRQMRDRAYEYCFLRDGAIDQTCSQEQDDALHSAAATLMNVETQRRMPNKSSLSDKERRVADDPRIVSQARSYCWSLYDAHGGRDARLLAICLSNLTDSSSLVPIPVPEQD